MFRYEFVEVPLKGGLKAEKQILLRNARKSSQKKRKKAMSWFK